MNKTSLMSKIRMSQRNKLTFGIVSASLLLGGVFFNASYNPRNKLKNYRVRSFPLIQGKQKVKDSIHPLAITSDRKGNIFVTGEFQRALYKIDRRNRSTQIPFPKEGPIFLWGKNKTDMNSWGEDIITDSKGRVWVTQGGAGYLANGKTPGSHSRILRIDPNGKLTTYHIPGDHNVVTGIRWDKKRNRIWFVESGVPFRNPKLVSFVPEEIDTSVKYDSPARLQSLRCRPGQTRDCYRTHKIPYGFPAHLAIDARGDIWFTGYFENYLGKFSPRNGRFERFPLNKEKNKFHPDIRSSYPWDIQFDHTTGDVVLTETFDFQIVRFQVKKSKRVNCKKLRNGKNPCVIEYRAHPAGFNPMKGAINGTRTHLMTHSLDIDSRGNIWFTFAEYVGMIPRGSKSPQFKKLFKAKKDKDHVTGIHVDRYGEVWVSDYFNKRMFRLTYGPNRKRRTTSPSRPAHRRGPARYIR